MKLEFKNKTFCFTGEFANGIKRKVLEEEIKKCGGLFLKSVNRELDYLVIGEKGSQNWKYGKYGGKIENAKKLKVIMILEDDFMDVLGETIPDKEKRDIHAQKIEGIDDLELRSFKDYREGTSLFVGFLKRIDHL